MSQYYNVICSSTDKNTLLKLINSFYGMDNAFSVDNKNRVISLKSGKQIGIIKKEGKMLRYYTNLK